MTRLRRAPPEIKVLLGTLLSLACSGADGDNQVFSPCQVPGSTETLECATYEVFEDRESGEGRKIGLHIVRARARNPSADKPPIFFLSGGPGVSATVSAARDLKQWAGAREHRDLVFVDQRGTGESNALNCNLLEAGGEVQSFIREAIDIEGLKRCRNEIERHADLTKYTTPLSAADLNEVREALGYEQVVLKAVSYGTRVALELIRRHGEHVESGLLFGVAPAWLNSSTVARDVENAMDRLIADCLADGRCVEAYPDLREELDRVLERLRRGPVQVHFPERSMEQPVLLSYGATVTGLRYFLDDVGDSSRIPWMIHRAALDDYLPIAEAVISFWKALTDPTFSMSWGLWASVQCTEEAGHVELNEALQAAEGTFFGPRRLLQEADLCGDWPTGDLSVDFYEPVVSNVPILLVAAELDPTTPPRFAAFAARYLANSRLVIVKNRSHLLRSTWETCVGGVANAFLQTPSPEDLDSSCAEDFVRPPFVLGQ